MNTDILLIVAAVVAGLLVIGVPIGFALVGSTVLGLFLITGSTTAATGILLVTSFDVTSSIPYLVIPLFILMGTIAGMTGIINDLFDAAYKTVGRYAGGMAFSTLLAAAAFASVTGSSISSAAAMGKIALPQMLRFKYKETLSAGIIVASGTLAMLIPPSVILVLYGIVAQQSIGKLLIAGIIPGLISVIFYAAVIKLIVYRNPLSGPRGPAYSLGEIRSASLKATPFILVLIALLGGMFLGIWTPTEAAAGGVIIVSLIGFAKRKLHVRGIYEASLDAVVTSASVFILVIGSLLFSKFLALSGVTPELIRFITESDLSPFAFFLILIVVFLILGTFLEAVSLISLTVPIILPIAAQLGWDPIWFGIFLVKMIEIGAMTPPVGLNLFALKSVAPQLSLGTITVGAMPFWMMDIIFVLTLYFFPGIVTFLPSMM